MPKQTPQDVVPKDKRSIRDIPVLVNRRYTTRRPDADEEIDEVAESTQSSRARGGGHSKIVLWSIAFLSVLVLVVGVSSLFSTLTLQVVPKTEVVSVDQDVIAYRERKDTWTGPVYTVMTISRESTVDVPATGEESVSTKASGTIVVYNKYTTASQRLIKNTRFESAHGLIYRIKDGVVIPGAKKNGTELLPGSIEVVVFADEPGEKYNVGLSDFTIPGFKGDPRYTTFYGRSKTPITGGYVGMVKKVDPTVRENAVSKLKEKITSDLTKEAIAEKPDGFVLYDKAKTIEFVPISDTVSGDAVIIGLRGTLSGTLFETKQLATFIAEAVVKGYAEEPVTSPDIEKLNFFPKPFISKSGVVTDQLTFHLSGTARIVYAFDESAFKKDVAGKSFSDITALLKKYPTIVSVKTLPQPFWSRSAPTDLSTIRVVLQVPEK